MKTWYETWMSIAKEIMIFSVHPKARIGAAIVYKKELLSQGYNKEKTHPKAKNYSRHIHAELDAILNVSAHDRHKLEKASIYLYRENKKGKKAICKPCKFCQELLDRVGIKKIYYTEG